MARHRSLTTHVAMCCHLIVQDRVLGFSRTVSALPMSLTGIDRLEAVHRAYEAALCATPHPYLADVHAAMLAMMINLKLVRRGRGGLP